MPSLSGRLRILSLIAFAAMPAAAKAAIVVTDCGALIGSRVFTNSTTVRTSSTTFVKLGTTRITVPSGQTRCIKVLVTAETLCAGPAGLFDFCDIRVTSNGVETLHPQGGNFKTIDSEDNTPAGHAFEWVGRVNAGTYFISVEVRVRDGRSLFEVDDLTFDVQTFF